MSHLRFKQIKYNNFGIFEVFLTGLQKCLYEKQFNAHQFKKFEFLAKTLLQVSCTVSVQLRVEFMISLRSLTLPLIGNDLLAICWKQILKKPPLYYDLARADTG